MADRERQLAALQRALDADRRVVVVEGPPGIGRSWLVRELAHRWRQHGGMAVVCAVPEGAGLAAACTQGLEALGAPAGAGDPVGQLGLLLRPIGGQALLVLDDLDRADRAWPKLERLRMAAPMAAIVATSRVQQSWESAVFHPLGPLPTWGEGGDPSPAEQLFLDGADRVCPGFSEELDPRGRSLVRAIVDQLGGHPLAITLVASRAGVRDLEGLLARVSQGADDVDVSDRLRRSLEVSWQLLEPVEQRAAAGCSPFRGGFDLVDAERIVDLGTDRSVEEELAGLVSKLWLDSRPADGGVRLDMSPVLRDFAAGELPQVAAQATDRHRRLFLDRCDAWYRSGSTLTLDERRAAFLDRHNVWVAAERDAAASEDPARLLRVATTLPGVASQTRPKGQVRALLERALAACEGLDGIELPRIHARLHLGDLLRVEGDLGRARPLLRRALADSRTAGDPRTLRLALIAIGYALLVEGDRSAARAHWEEALALGPMHPREEAALWAALGGVADQEGVPDARRYYERAVALLRDQGPDLWHAGHLASLGATCIEEGLMVEAAAWCEAGVAMALASGSPATAGVARVVLATVHLVEDALEPARAELEQALIDLEAVGWLRELSGCHVAFAALTRLEGSPERAEEHLERGLPACRAARERAHCLAQLGAVRGARGQLEEGAALWEEATALARSETPNVRRMVALEEGHLWLARAVRALERDDRTEAAACLAAARGLREGAAGCRGEARTSLRLLERAIEGFEVDFGMPSDPRLKLTEEGFTLDGVAVDCTRKPVIRALLQALATHRRARPGVPMSAEVLMAEVWPGEKMRADSARNRLHAALTQLRRLGLQDVLQTRADGYLIDPSCRIVED